MYSRTRLLVMAGLAVLAITLVGVAACGDDDDDDNGGASAVQIEELAARIERVEVATALNTIDSAELHGIDEELQEASEIPSGTAGTIERVYAVVSATQWPDDLSELADTLTHTLEEFIAALDADDLAASKGLATDTHDASHELEHSAYDWVAGEEHAEEEDGHGAEESPAAEETGG